MIDTNEYLADALKFLQTEAKEIEKEEEKEEKEEVDETKKEDDAEEKEEIDEDSESSEDFGSMSEKQKFFEKVLLNSPEVKEISTKVEEKLLKSVIETVASSMVVGQAGQLVKATEVIKDQATKELVVNAIKNAVATLVKSGKIEQTFAKYVNEEKESEDKEEEEEVDERTDLECASDQLKKESKKTEDEEEEEEIKEIDEDGKLLPLRKNDKEGLVTVTASESKKDDEKEEEIDEEADKRTPLEFWRDMWSRYKDVFAWARVIKTYYDPEKDALKDTPVDNIKEDTSVVDKLKNLLKTAKGSISVDDLKDILGASTIAKEGVEMEEKEEELDESKMGDARIIISDLKKKGLKGEELIKAVADELSKTLKDKSKAEEVAKGLLGEEKEDEDETKEEKIEESLKRVASLLV